MIRRSSANAAWLELLAQLLQDGEVVRPRGRETREILGVQLRFPSTRPLVTFEGRRLNYRFAAAEALWMLLGRRDVASLARVNPKMRAYSDDGAFLAGAYGPRFREQLPWVLERLREDPETRQAVVEIWRPRPAPSKDVPCTLSWQFLLRGGKLHLLATMRSSDAWLGVPYDAFSFSVVLQYVAGLVGAEPGDVLLTLGSSHLYEDDAERAREVLRAPRCETVALELEPLADPEYVETVAERALEKGVLVHLRALPEQWTRLLRMICASTSAEALERLRG